jgi:hypothetical protein
MSAKVTIALLEQGITLATRTAEIRGRIGEVFAMLDSVPAAQLSVLVALESGYLDTKLKAIDRLAKVSELEFGTKSKVETTAKPVAPATREEERDQLVELEREIADRKREIDAEKGQMQ